ncbi:MAG: transcription termination/antitermination protein NusG [Planctomycetota bacterium]
MSEEESPYVMTDETNSEQPEEQLPGEPEERPEVEDQIDEDDLLVMPGMNWFVLRVASNKESSVRKTLLRKIKIEGYDGEDEAKPHLVNRILVPTEKTKTIKAGKQKIVETKLYPGYVFVEMMLEDDGRIPQDIFFLIKETTGVGDFIGTAGRPSPMSIPEIEKMLMASKPAEEQPQVKMEYQKGDHVKITSGAFENMEATVDELMPDQGKVKVIVTIFGRATPVELEYWIIERIEE